MSVRGRERVSERGGESNTFFVANLPPGCSAKELQVKLGEFGEVTRSFVAPRRDRAGRFFGFVDFSRVAEPSQLVKRLRGFVFRGEKLVFKLAKFDKNAPLLPFLLREKVSWRQKVVIPIPLGGAFLKNGISFADATRKGVVEEDKLMKVVIPNNSKPVGYSLTETLVGRLKDFQTLRTFHRLAQIDALQNNDIVYIGGLFILIRFTGTELANRFLENIEVWGSWFLYLDSWEGQSLPFERIAWIKVYGVPPHLWDRQVFDAIGARFGDLIHPSQVSSTDGNWTYDCLGVLRSDGRKVSEEIMVVWRGKYFRCWVVEEAEDWIPDCIEGWSNNGVTKQGVKHQVRVSPESTPEVSNSHSIPTEAGKSAAGIQEIEKTHGESNRIDNLQGPTKEAGSPTVSAREKESQLPFSVSCFTPGSSQLTPKRAKPKKFSKPKNKVTHQVPSPNNKSRFRKRPRVEDDPFGLDAFLDLNKNLPSPVENGGRRNLDINSIPEDVDGVINSNIEEGALNDSSQGIKDQSKLQAEIQAKIELAEELGVEMNQKEDIVEAAILEEGEIFDNQ